MSEQRMGADPRHWVIAVDWGLRSSKAAMTGDDGTPSVLEVGGRPELPSAVLLDPGQSLLVGTAADEQEARWPDRLERMPKQYVGTPGFLLGGVQVAAPAAAAELFRLLLDEGTNRHGGRPPGRVVLTHPAHWSGARTAELHQAADQAGLTGAELVGEHIAVATHFADDRVTPGGHVAIFDLGAAALKTAVLRRTDAGFELAGPPSAEERPAGDNFDWLVYQYLGWCVAQQDAELWRQLAEGDELRWRQERRDLLNAARRAKEAVSRWPRTQAHVAVVDRDFLLTREQFEDMIVEEVERAIDDFERSVQATDLEPSQLAAIYMVGGSSRIPLVQRQMMQRYDDLVTVTDDPQAVVALGAVQWALAGGPRWSQRTGDLLTSETARRTVDRIQVASDVARVRANDLAQTLRSRTEVARLNLTIKAGEFGIHSGGADLAQMVDKAAEIIDETRVRLGGESRLERMRRKLLRDVGR